MKRKLKQFEKTYYVIINMVNDYTDEWNDIWKNYFDTYHSVILKIK